MYKLNGTVIIDIPKPPLYGVLMGSDRRNTKILKDRISMLEKELMETSGSYGIPIEVIDYIKKNMITTEKETPSVGNVIKPQDPLYIDHTNITSLPDKIIISSEQKQGFEQPLKELECYVKLEGKTTHDTETVMRNKTEFLN